MCSLAHRQTQREKMTAAELYEVIKLSVPEIFGALKDTVVMAASVTGIYVAFKGLGTWKRQIKGQSEYALAKETLINIYKVRDEIIRVRNPMMMTNEQPEPPEDKARKMNEDEISFYGLSEAYNKRLEKVVSAKSILLVNLTESEAMWGLHLKELAKQLFKQQRYLTSKINFYLVVMNPKINERAKEIFLKDLEVIHSVVFDSLEENDEYNKKLNESIKPMEEYLRDKMGS